MKKIFVIFLLMFCSILPCFSEYKPIPKELSTQYKADMEQIIDNGYPKAIKNIDEYFNEVEQKYFKLVKNGFDQELYWSMVPEVSIYDVDLFIYDEMLKITQEKYLKNIYKSYGTDSTFATAEFLAPYIKDNNVNIDKLINIGNYASLKDKTIEKYSKNIKKLYPSEF